MAVDDAGPQPVDLTLFVRLLLDGAVTLLFIKRCLSVSPGAIAPSDEEVARLQRTIRLTRALALTFSQASRSPRGPQAPFSLGARALVHSRTVVDMQTARTALRAHIATLLEFAWRSGDTMSVVVGEESDVQRVREVLSLDGAPIDYVARKAASVIDELSQDITRLTDALAG